MRANPCTIFSNVKLWSTFLHPFLFFNFFQRQYLVLYSCHHSQNSCSTTTRLKIKIKTLGGVRETFPGFGWSEIKGMVAGIGCRNGAQHFGVEKSWKIEVGGDDEMCVKWWCLLKNEANRYYVFTWRILE